MRQNVICFTERGKETARKIAELLGCDYCRHSETNMTLDEWTRQSFQGDAIVFVGAVGIAVRAIAPYIKSKDSDPAVVVVDEKGQFVIPILSGHIGGANLLAERIARRLEATAVITTATDINGVFAVDSFAVQHNMTVKNIDKIKDVSSKLLAGQTAYYCDKIGVDSKFPDNVRLSAESPDFYIDTYKHDDTLTLVPKTVAVGIGCKKGTKAEDIKALLLDVLNENNIYIESINEARTIDIKKDEQGIKELCRELDIPLKTYPADVLNSLSGDFTASDFVMNTVGTDCVCERCASMEDSELIVEKQARNGVTIALGKAHLT